MYIMKMEKDWQAGRVKENNGLLFPSTFRAILNLLMPLLSLHLSIFLSHFPPLPSTRALPSSCGWPDQPHGLYAETGLALWDGFLPGIIRSKLFLTQLLYFNIFQT